MGKKRLLGLIVIGLPIAVLVALVVARKRNATDASLPYSSGGWPITSNQIAKTINDWNSVAPDEYLDASDRSKLDAVLGSLLDECGLSTIQSDELRASAVGLIGGIGSGDYDMFIKARIPLSDFQFPEGVVDALHRYSGLAKSSPPLDHYRSVWVSTFRTNRLWSQILFVQANAMTFKTNSSLPKAKFEFPRYLGDDNARVESFTTTALDYRASEEAELRGNRMLLTCQLFFMGKEPVLNEARPFMITLFWSEAEKKWVPIGFLHAFINNPATKYRFF